MPRINALEAAVKRMPLDLLGKHALQRLRNLERQRERSNRYSRTEKARKTKQRAYYKSTNVYHPVFSTTRQMLKRRSEMAPRYQRQPGRRELHCRAGCRLG